MVRISNWEKEKMGYKRPEDQYKISRAKEMIEQLKREKLGIKCTFTTVKNYRQIPFQNVSHAGTLSHICNKVKGHEGNCECDCGVQFQGWNN